MRKLKTLKQLKMEEALEYAEGVVKTVRDPLIVLGADLRVISANKSFYRTFRVNAKETEGRFIYNLGNRQWNIPKLRQLLNNIIKKNNHFDNFKIEHDFETIGPKIMLLNARRIPRLPEKPRILLLAIEDVTERRKIEDALKASEESFKSIFDGAGDGILLAEAETKKFYAGNKAICRMLGYSLKEISHLGISDICFKKAIPYAVEQFKELAKGKLNLSINMPMKRKNGSVFYADVSATSVKIAGKLYVMGFLRDTTEHRELQQALENIREAKEKTILAAIGDGVMACDNNGKIIVFNHVASELTGFSSNEAIGRHYSQVLSLIREDTDKPGKDFIGQALREGKTILMANHTMIAKKDGTKIPVADSAAPFFDSKGKIFGCVVVFRDVTKEREVEKMKNEFISFASHQLRSPLVGIQWVIERILKKEKLTIGLQGYLQDIRVSVQRLSDLVNDLLNISRFERGKSAILPKQVDLVPFIENYIVECTPLSIKKGVALTFEEHPEALNVVTDSNILRNVMQSLVSNALEYTHQGGSVKVSLEKKDGHFLFTVQDTGIGIPKKEQSVIFEKFGRGSNAKLIKPSGSGLGLYLAKQAAEVLGGKIWFESQENKGTIFYVKLPLKSKSKNE